MSDVITLTGVVASPPRAITTQEGLAITSFRLASSQRRFDRAQQKWVDGETNWYTVTTFRQLATNAAVSVKKGERIIVTGRLRIRDWESGGKTGTNVDVEAEAIGHDLSWGTAAFSRSAGSTTAEASGDSGIDSGHGQLSDQVGSALDVGSSTFPSEVELASSDDGQPLALVGASAGSGSSNEPVTPF
jgi:single-strand DNA-binding protein